MTAGQVVLGHLGVRFGVQPSVEVLIVGHAVGAGVASRLASTVQPRRIRTFAGGHGGSAQGGAFSGGAPGAVDDEQRLALVKQEGAAGRVQPPGCGRDGRLEARAPFAHGQHDGLGQRGRQRDWDRAIHGDLQRLGAVEGRLRQTQAQPGDVGEFGKERVGAAGGEDEARGFGGGAPFGDFRPPAAHGATVEGRVVDVAHGARVGPHLVLFPSGAPFVALLVVPHRVAVAGGLVEDHLAAQLAQAGERTARVQHRHHPVIVAVRGVNRKGDEIAQRQVAGVAASRPA